MESAGAAPLLPKLTTMKKLFLLLFVATGALAACHRKAAETVQEPATAPQDQAITQSDETVEPPTKSNAYLVAAFEKTACFGKCPVYQVKFYSDGKVTWYGRMNVERQGWYTAQVLPDVLKRIKAKANELNYFDLEAKYPTDLQVADLPSTITYVRIGDMEKQVVNTHDAPENLLAFEQFLSELIEGLDWRAEEK